MSDPKNIHEVVEWCIRQLDRMHEDLTAIKRDLAEMKHGPERARQLTEFEAWAERNLRGLERDG